MKLTTYRVFWKRLQLIPEIVALNAKVSIFRFHNESWLDEQEKIVVNPALKGFLERTRLEPNQNYRPTKQKISFFWIDTLQSVVAVDCQIYLRTPKLEKISKALTDCCLNAKNEFDASHDALTLLPNRKYFEETLEAQVAKIAESRTPNTSPTVGLSSRVLTLLAFDLDHFKQINDTFGHPYGDVVLAAFAWRLEEFAKTIEITRQLEVYPARLGGEEFQLLIVGLVDELEGLELANEFRQLVSKNSLPSELEWKMLSVRRGIANDRLPPDSERTLSVSIGHSLLTSIEAQSLIVSLGSAIRVASTLIDQADAALYRAKTDGRDCARSFREIKDRLGRVLEHHSETGIVTIDIGTEVGVKSGMEFLVYHPHFYGNFPFYQKETRTKKMLGTYPKYPSGRLTIFESSREISFAQVIENKQQSLFHEGSRLEYVPLGSFTHLVTSPLERSQPNLASYEQLVEQTKQLVAAKKRIVAINLAILDMESLVIARGTAHGNDILAAMYRLIRSSFDNKAAIATTAATEFLILMEYESKITGESIVKKIKNIIDEISKNAKCTAGVYDSKSTKINSQKPEMAIECARMARSQDEIVSTFTEKISQRVIQNWRSRRAWTEGIADYIRLKSFGLSSAEMENAAGLCYLEQQPAGDFPSAIQCFAEAIALAAQNGENDSGGLEVYELNLAYTYTASRAYQAAVNIFRKYSVLSSDEPKLISPVYMAAYARALYFLNDTNSSVVPSAEVKRVFSEALNGAKDYLSQEWIKAISALEQKL